MQTTWAVAAFAIAAFIPSGTSASAARPRAATQCSWGGNTFSLLDSPKGSTIGSYNTVKISGRMLAAEDGGEFTFFRSGSPVIRKLVKDVSNPNGWLGVSNDFHTFSLNTSNGGAGGGWSVSIIHVPDTGSATDLSAAMKAVEKDFSKRHYCKARGNNYEAIQWRSNTQLLVSASVYGTSDCGAEMGYTEGYVLDVTSGKIVAHLSEAQMLNLPYVCTYNVWQSGDPNPGQNLP